MKAVLISIQPKWCELIANSKKTIEIRKTRPKLATPFKVYIYCTYGEGLIEANDEFLPNHLIGEKVSKNKIWDNCCNGKVIGEFVCDEIIVAECGNYVALGEGTMLSALDLLDYADEKTVYGWHILDLVIYDKPKELGEFFKACDKPKGTDCSVCVDHRKNRCKAITRPPQSWCYVESEVSE